MNDTRIKIYQKNFQILTDLQNASGLKNEISKKLI